MSSEQTMRALAFGLPDAKEQETWGRPTFRVHRAIFATLHDHLLILRGEPGTQAARLKADSRLSSAPYWGRNGRVALLLADTSDDELPELLAAAYELAAGQAR